MSRLALAALKPSKPQLETDMIQKQLRYGGFSSQNGLNIRWVPSPALPAWKRYDVTTLYQSKNALPSA